MTSLFLTQRLKSFKLGHTFNCFILSRLTSHNTVSFQSIEIPKNMFGGLDVFHVYLMRGFQKYEQNCILTMAFRAACKIAQPIQPIWQHIFALPWSALKKPPSEFNFFHIFGIPSSSRHEKRCQMLQTLFWLFQCSKNPR